MDSGSIKPSGWCVRVECKDSPPQQFNYKDIGKLFQGHVGAVVGATEHFENGKKWINIEFSGEDELKKALCMSGYTIDETSIQVTSLSNRQFHAFAKPKSKGSLKLKREPDTRRNLYILNLPHDLSAQAYRELFTAHGTPTHTVLLKTQDSCSRRRGFVVMSTHEEAQNVIRWLDGICIRGFQLRVTWANIDRSNGFDSFIRFLSCPESYLAGFMSGYDRSTFLGQNCNISSNCSASISSTSIEQKSPGIGMDTNTIVASNIPISLFPDQEIDSLFKPFGIIKKIQLIPPNASAEDPLSTLAPASPFAQTAIVTYKKSDDAIAAKNTLHGQVYDGFALAVGFVSKLGIENHQVYGSALATPALVSSEFSPPIPISATTGKVPFTTPGLAFEMPFRGVPTSIDLYNVPARFQYCNDFSGQTAYSNLSGHPSLPQAIAHQTQQKFRVPSQYVPELALPLPERRYTGSHFAHHPDASGMS